MGSSILVAISSCSAAASMGNSIPVAISLCSAGASMGSSIRVAGAVGPTAGGGITLPSMRQPPPPLHPTPTSPTARPHHHYYLFSIKQLNTLGGAAMLAFSTTVPLSEIAFAVLLIPYLVLLATLAFPQRPGKPNPVAPVFLGPGCLLLAAQTVAGFLVGAALPALYILDGLRSGDTTGVAAAAPHALPCRHRGLGRPRAISAASSCITGESSYSAHELFVEMSSRTHLLVLGLRLGNLNPPYQNFCRQPPKASPYQQLRT